MVGLFFDDNDVDVAGLPTNQALSFERPGERIVGRTKVLLPGDGMDACGSIDAVGLSNGVDAVLGLVAK